jgi:uncharacterized membrane protein
VPISRLRRKNVFTPPQERTAVRVGNPRWLVPLMLAFFLIGLLWIVVFYLTSGERPVASLGMWNLGVGFGMVILGFIIATRWR